MATRLRLLFSQYNVYPGARDFSLSRNAATAIQQANTTVVGGETELPVNMTTSGEPSLFVSSPMFTPVTIGSTITLKMFLKESITTVDATVRVKFWRVTSGGSDVESYLGQIDATTEASTSSITAIDFTGTLTGAELGAGDRLLIRIYAIPVSGASSLGAGTLTLSFAASYGAVTDSYVEFTDDLPVGYEGAGFFLRDTTVLGISGFFDLWHTPGASPVDAVVTTTSGGTSIQWTLTAGGTALAWISKRVRQKLTFTTPTTGITTLYPYFQGEAKESVAGVNAGVAVRCWKRNLAGVETSLWGPYGPTAELTTTLASIITAQGNPVGTPNLTATLDENDRLVVRVYAVNKGTMGAGTATFRYNQIINATGTGAAAFQIGAMGVLFKEESEPDFPVVNNAIMTTGAGTM